MANKVIFIPNKPAILNVLGILEMGLQVKIPIKILLLADYGFNRSKQCRH